MVSNPKRVSEGETRGWGDCISYIIAFVNSVLPERWMGQSARWHHYLCCVLWVVSCCCIVSYITCVSYPLCATTDPRDAIKSIPIRKCLSKWPFLFVFTLLLLVSLFLLMEYDKIIVIYLSLTMTWRDEIMLDWWCAFATSSAAVASASADDNAIDIYIVMMMVTVTGVRARNRSTTRIHLPWMTTSTESDWLTDGWRDSSPYYTQHIYPPTHLFEYLFMDRIRFIAW